MPWSLIPRIWEKTNVAPGSPGTVGMVGSAIAVPVRVPFSRRPGSP